MMKLFYLASVGLCLLGCSSEEKVIKTDETIKYEEIQDKTIYELGKSLSELEDKLDSLLDYLSLEQYFYRHPEHTHTYYSISDFRSEDGCGFTKVRPKKPKSKDWTWNEKERKWIGE